MKALALLRTLAEFQQYPQLQQTAQQCWDDSQAPAILPLLALAYAYLGDMTQANAYYEQAQAHKASLDGDSLCDLAAVFIVMQQRQQAALLLNEVLAAEPEHALALARLAYCKLAANAVAEAQALFEQSLSINTQRVTVYTNLIALYMDQQNVEPAQQQLEKAFITLGSRQHEYPEELYQQYWVQLNSIQLQLWVSGENSSEQNAQAEDWLHNLYKQQQAGECEETLFIHCLKHYSHLLAERDQHQQASDILREYAKQYPANTELCLALSELEQVQGHFMQAVNLLQKAIKHDSENIGLWVQLSSACLHRFDKKARQAAEKAMELAEALEPSDEKPLALIKIQQAQAKNALAQLESQEHNYEISTKLYRQILAEHSHFLPALQGLGQQEMEQGNIEEALALFERVKAIDPLKGHSALINARRFPEDIDTLEKMEKAATQPSLEGPLRAGILFQLAAAWEKRKNYDKAFDCAQQANAATKKFLAYDAKAHRNKCARLRVRFAKPLYEHRADCGVDSTMPVYVLGMPRSGTTLVEQILAGHSDIFGAGELGVIPQVVQGMNRWERHTGSGRKFPDCIDDLNAYATAGIAHNVLKELQELAAEDALDNQRPEAHYVVDKLPHNFENIGLIKFLFPKAKIISVRRDPRDIALSNFFTDYQSKYGGMGFAYDLETIGEQLADHNMMMHHWQQTFPGEILEMNYEDVVDDLEASARKMLNYIGVEWQPQVLKFNALERTVKTASVWQVRQPIYKTSKAKWKHYEHYLAPLIKGTNGKILPDAIDDMFTLSEGGFLTDGMAFYKAGDMDAAEMHFKKMLHHNPEHAACNYMVGLVYMSKNHPVDGIAQIEKALKKVPWHKEWRDNLLKAYEQEGETEKAEAMMAQVKK